MAQTVKNLPAMQEIQVWSLGREDPQEKEMAIHSSILAWEIPETEEPGGLQFMESPKVRHDWVTNTLHLKEYQQTELSNVTKEYIKTKLYLLQECKVGLTFKDQST